MITNRRTFIAAGAAIVSTPAWVSRAFAQVDNGRDRGRELRELSAAYRRAEQGGRPLLVLIVPEDGGARWEHAHAFGEMLNHGDDRLFAALVLAEVACSSMQTLRQLVPQAGAGEPWMVLVEPSQHPATARSIEVQIPELPNQWGQGDITQEIDRTIDRRVAALSGAVRSALARDDAMVQQRARVAEQRLDAALVRRVHAAVRGGQVGDDLLHAAPAIVRVAARRSSARRGIEAALVTHARNKLVQGPVAGSQWAIDTGCGAVIESAEEHLTPPCGMGHVAPRSRRFLYWYTG